MKSSRASSILRGILFAGLALAMPPGGSASDGEGVALAADSAAAFYSVGITWDQYLAGTKNQRELWQKNAGRPVPADLVERFRRAAAGLRLLIVTADWCTDSVNSVPYVATLASRAGVELRVLDFRTGKPVMEAHRTPDGRASTPTIVLLRKDREVAAWVERPATLQWWFLQAQNDLGEAELLERKTAWYEWNRGADTLEEIVVLAERAAKDGAQ